MTLTAAAFRKALGEFATGVAVVTFPPASAPTGVTVEGFAGVSLSPPLVVICLDRESPAHERLTDADCDSFCVNLLTADQRDLAQHFAGVERLPRDPFETRPTRRCPSDAPAFERSLAYLDCRVRSRTPVGDHALWVSRVVTGARPERGADPLVFFRGEWGSVDPVPTVPTGEEFAAESDAD